MRAVVFAYHDVGAECLRVLRRHDVDVPLVVTHLDDPAENLWFERVADVARSLGLPCATPADPNVPDFVARVASLAPEFIFSFYYRQMLSPAMLATAARGALNVHGSLLPHYRGRAPVNWAILRGETSTGATLHYMSVKPDAGDIVAQRAVPIGPDDTAHRVFDRVTQAAAALLDDVLPALAAGTAPRLRNDIAAGSYFGGRRPDDGRIDWNASAAVIHNLVRAVAPPYPGAFCEVGGRRIRILATRIAAMCPPQAPEHPGLFVAAEAMHARAGDGRCLAVLAADHDGHALMPQALRALLGDAP